MQKCKFNKMSEVSSYCISLFSLTRQLKTKQNKKTPETKFSQMFCYLAESALDWQSCGLLGANFSILTDS